MIEEKESFHAVKLKTLNENRMKVKKTMGINQSIAMSYCIPNLCKIISVRKKNGVRTTWS